MTPRLRGICTWCGKRVDVTTPSKTAAVHPNGDIETCYGSNQPPAYTFRPATSRELWLEDILGEPRL